MTGSTLHNAGDDALTQRRFVEAVSGLFDVETACNLFRLLNRIAVLSYEDAANNGLLILCGRAAYDSLLCIRFEQSFALKDVGGVRKMLQISGQQISLVCDGRDVLGFTPAGEKPHEALTVQFHSHHAWELKQCGSVVVQVYPTHPSTVLPNLREEHFIVTARAVFGKLTGVAESYLWSLVSAATRQDRGTNVLITKHAAAEAKRLASQCTTVSPVILTPLLMDRLTSIDGTVVIDPQGVCYAIGAILDGPVAVRGDRTRGGRYNSALMFVDQAIHPCIIVVVSQNGAVDLVFQRQRLAEK